MKKQALILSVEQLHVLCSCLFPTHWNDDDKEWQCRLVKKTNTGFIFEIDGFGKHEVHAEDILVVQDWGITFPTKESGLS